MSDADTMTAKGRCDNCVLLEMKSLYRKEKDGMLVG